MPQSEPLVDNATLIAAMTAALEDGVDGPQALPAEVTSNRMLFILQRAAPLLAARVVERLAARIRENVDDENELLDAISEVTGTYLFEDSTPEKFASGVAAYIESIAAEVVGA